MPAVLPSPPGSNKSAACSKAELRSSGFLIDWERRIQIKPAVAQRSAMVGAVVSGMLWFHSAPRQQSQHVERIPPGCNILQPLKGSDYLHGTLLDEERIWLVTDTAELITTEYALK